MRCCSQPMTVAVDRTSYFEYSSDGDYQFTTSAVNTDTIRAFCGHCGAEAELTEPDKVEILERVKI